MNARMERRLERLSMPVLVLAGIAIALYMLELFRLIPASLRVPMIWANFLIDFVFFLDLCSKLIILRTKYIKSPWFLIDLVSTLPLISSTIEVLGAVGPQLEATRAARGARVARVARVARIARVARAARAASALREIRGQSFRKEGSAEQETPAFDRSLMIAIPFLLAVFIVIAYFLTQQELKYLQANLSQRVEAASTREEIHATPQYLDAGRARDPHVEKIYLTKEIDGRPVEFAFSAEEAHVRADRAQGFMLIVVLLTTAGVVYMTRSLSTDENKGEETSILHQFLSPSIVEKIDSNPEVVERFYNQWLSVFFITIRGFNQAAASSDGNIEDLALRRRQVMDIVRHQAVDTYSGIVDKFMGDTVMIWLGGPFSVHWNRLASFRERLFLDELEYAEQDIRSIRRAMEAIGQEQTDGLMGTPVEEEFMSTPQERLDNLEEIRREVEAKRDKLLAEHQAAKSENPSLEPRHQEAVQMYKMQAGKSAVLCCLDIWDDVAKQTGENIFRELSIGVASGPVSVGNFGSTQQIGFTVLGPTVDRAARLEPVAEQYGCRLLVDLETYDLVKESAELQFRMMPHIAIEEGAEPIPVYEPFKRDTVEQAFLDAFHEGVFAMQRDEFETAIQYFQSANELRSGGDTASLKWAEACAAVLHVG